jgi:chorismate-pyruvate lyase
MSIPAKLAGPELPSLFALFPPSGDMPEYELVPAEQVPPPYYELLVHPHHMTVTVEKHHRDLVNVRILQRCQVGDSYARKILLALQGTGRVVQFGIARVHLQYVNPAVRDEILAGRTPLGRILIQHDVLRQIVPTAFLRVRSWPAMAKWFGREGEWTTYGRLAWMHCDGQPAIELLEIVAPE